MKLLTHVVHPKYTDTFCDPIAPYMYRKSERICLFHGDDYPLLVPRGPGVTLASVTICPRCILLVSSLTKIVVEVPSFKLPLQHIFQT